MSNNKDKFPDIDTKKVETETVIDKTDPKVHAANEELRDFGRRIAPPGTDYMGSICTHMYRDRFVVGYQFMTLHPTGKASEPACIMAVKKLRSVVIKAFEDAKKGITT